MKKLMYFICLAVVFVLVTQNAAAQGWSGGQGPASAVGNVTNGRFSSDVDDFFSVNDWADIDFTKWFGYLRMEDIRFNRTPDNWEGGLALDLNRFYLGLYYYGQFNTGRQNNWERIVYDENGGTTTLYPDFSNVNPAAGILTGWNRGPGTGDPFTPGAGVERRNYFGILVGVGNHGFKFTLEDNLNSLYLPNITATNNTFANIPNNVSEGSFRYRNSWVTPRIQWGAASDMTFGRFTTRPSASIALKVNYNNSYSFTNLKDAGGIAIDDVNRHDNNSLTPMLGVDTGAMALWSGDWGTFKVGASENFAIEINDTGNNAWVSWENKLMPYAVFSYDANEFFRMGVKLTVPVWFGWGGGAENTATGNFFGIGAKGDAVTNGALNATPVYDFPTLHTGFQLKASTFDKLTDRYGILDRLVINWGILVNFPGYLDDGDFTNNRAVNNSNLTIVRERSSGWVRNNSWLQEVYGGFSFYITPNAVLDFDIGGNSGGVNGGRIVFSIKHNPPGGGSRSTRAAVVTVVPTEEAAVPDAAADDEYYDD